MKTIDDRRGERKKWSDERLTLELANAAAGERGSLVELLLDLVEFDHRSLSQKGAHHTLFDYCTRRLGYSSSEAGRRIAVARKGETFPMLVEMIERGELHLSGAAMLAGLLKAPTKFAPHINLPAARARANVVLDNLVEAGFMTEGQVFGARRHPPTPVDRRHERAPNYYLDWASDQLKKPVDTFPNQ